MDKSSKSGTVLGPVGTYVVTFMSIYSYTTPVTVPCITLLPYY